MKRINHTTTSSTRKIGGRLIQIRTRRTNDQRWFPKVYTYDDESVQQNTVIVHGYDSKGLVPK